MVLFLYLPVEVAQDLLTRKEKSKTRRYLRGKKRDINESDVVYQQEVLKLYLKLAESYKHWELIKCVDKDGKILSIREIHEKILTVLRKWRIVKEK